MIKKLKLRYFVTNMALLCGTLLIFLGVLFAFMYHTEVNSSYKVMRRMLEEAEMPETKKDVPSPTFEDGFQPAELILLDDETLQESQPQETTPGFDPNQINPWDNQWANGWYSPWIYTPWIYNPWAYQWYANNGDPNQETDSNIPYGSYPTWGYYQQTDPQQGDQQSQQYTVPDWSSYGNWGGMTGDSSGSQPAQSQQNPQTQQGQQGQQSQQIEQQAEPETVQTEPQAEPEQTTPTKFNKYMPGGMWGGVWDKGITYFSGSKTDRQTQTEAVKPAAEPEAPAQNQPDPDVQDSAPEGYPDSAASPAAGVTSSDADEAIPNNRLFTAQPVLPIHEGEYVPNAMIAQMDENGNLASYAGLSISAGGYDENFNTVNQAYDEIKKKGSEFGSLKLNNTDYWYMNYQDRFILLDRSPELSLIRKLVSIFLIIALAGILVMFFISWKLANWTVTPIALAWDKQKQFVADASHELKTPLAVISANTEVIMANPSASVSGQSKWLNYIQSETMRMSKLISSLLSIARMDHAENTSDESEVLSLSDVVSNVCLQFEPIIYENGKTLNTVIQRKVMIKAEEDNVKQLLSILLDNAVLHSVPKAQITVSLSKDTQGKIRLAVSNTAKDIPKEQLEHLFDRFYRVDTEGSPNGSGLGLSIAKSIVQQLGGKINVTSENQLVTFTIVLSN